jgi:hypothetical protein
MAKSNISADEMGRFRIFHMAAGQILPLLEEEHQSAYEKLLYAFREGSTDLISLVAQCNALFQIIDLIKVRARLYEELANKSNTP